MKYCAKCIIPDTRPNISLAPDGICNACAAFDLRESIDWDGRAASFAAVAQHAIERGALYDCLIPVSGGKDSTWQVVKCLEAGLHPLAVTWKTPVRTELGAQNLANLISLGVDHIDYQINPRAEEKFVRAAFKRFGSTAIPMHMALFNIPLNIALRFDIPLIVWGENSAFEYGGTEDELRGFQLDETWLRKYGNLFGTTAKDWISNELSAQDLAAYYGPSPQDLMAKNILAVFLGYYFAWDPAESLRVARVHGFKSRVQGPKTGYYNYADIDDDFISIHHYLKWYKFGFTRLFDNLSLEIRHGRLTRAAALGILQSNGEERPVEDIRKFCQYAHMTQVQFDEVLEKFRNPGIWKRVRGQWQIENFIIPDWKWT